MPEKLRLLTAGWPKRLLVGVVVLLALLSAAGSVLAQLGVFTTVISPESGAAPRPGRALDAPETSTVAVVSGATMPSGGSVSPLSIIVTPPLLNNVARLDGSASHTSAAASPGSTRLDPVTATVAPLLNTVTVLTDQVAPQNISLASSPVSATFETKIETRIGPVPMEGTTTVITPSRTLLPGALQGRGMASLNAAVGQQRALAAPHRQGQPRASSTYQVAEVRSLHTEADSRMPVIERLIRPLVSFVPRRVSWGLRDMSRQNRGGAVEIGVSQASPSLSSGAELTGKAAALVSSVTLWRNSILVFNGSITPKQLPTGDRTYPVAAHLDIASRISGEQMSRADDSLSSTDTPLSRRVDGLSLKPASVPVTPASSILGGVVSPSMAPPSGSEVVGETKTLTGTISTIGAENQAPTVSSITAAQNVGTGTVAIGYSVTDNETSSVLVSLQYWNGSVWVNCSNASGSVGPVTTGTGKTATWDAKADFDGQFRNDVKIKVIADDGQSNNNVGSAESSAFTLDTRAPTGYTPGSPANGATDISVAATLTVAAATDDSPPVQYYFVLAKDSGFISGVQTSGWRPDNTWAASGLNHATQYWWKVKAKDAFNNETEYTPARSFVTQAAVPSIVVSPPSLNFGLVSVGTSSSPLTVTVSNSGSTSLTISTITIAGTHAAQFGKQNDNASGRTLAPGMSLTLKIVFIPASTGAKSATLSIPSNDPAHGVVNLALAGTGVVPVGVGGEVAPVNRVGVVALWVALLLLATLLIIIGRMVLNRFRARPS